VKVANLIGYPSDEALNVGNGSESRIGAIPAFRRLLPSPALSSQ